MGEFDACFTNRARAKPISRLIRSPRSVVQRLRRAKMGYISRSSWHSGTRDRAKATGMGQRAGGLPTLVFFCPEDLRPNTCFEVQPKTAVVIDIPRRTGSLSTNNLLAIDAWLSLSQRCILQPTAITTHTVAHRYSNPSAEKVMSKAEHYHDIICTPSRSSSLCLLACFMGMSTNVLLSGKSRADCTAFNNGPSQ